MRSLRGVLLVAGIGGGLLSQSETRTLQVTGAAATLADLLADCRRSLRQGPATAPDDRAHAVLGRLRLGDLEGAREVLDAAPDRTNLAAACWAIVTHHWYLRASGDLHTVLARLPHLQQALDAADLQQAPPAAFAAAALAAHAWFCLDALHGVAATPSPLGPDCRRRAVHQMLELERQAWQPGRGHFRPRLTGGRIVPPQPPEPSVLAPAAAGMLVATDDRLVRHLRTSLPQLLDRAPDDLRATAWLACAAAQLGDAVLLDAAWATLPALARAPGPRTAGDAGRLLDAVLFLITGLRLATGAGVDGGCLRLRPHLPPGHTRLLLQQLAADGARFDLDLALRRGELQPDEHGEAAMAGTGPGPRLRVDLVLRSTADARPRTFLLQGHGAQYVAALQPGDRLRRSLPIAPR